MSLKEFSALARRMKFAKLALKAQQSMSQLCRLFGLSRKSGYKWKRRFEREGPRGLRERTRRPEGSPQRTSPEWLKRIRQLHRRHRSWGSRKLAARLGKEYPRQKPPGARTIGKWLKRLKLNRPGRRRSWRGPQSTDGGNAEQPRVDSGLQRLVPDSGWPTSGTLDCA